jgi:uncharacterized membrane protein
VRLIKTNHLMIAAALTIAAVVATFLSYGVVRTLFTLPLVFVLPGYAIVAAFFPKRLASYPDNILFVLAWSLAMTSLGTVLLHKTPWGLTTFTWVIFLGGLTLANIAIALWQSKEMFDVGKTYSVPAYQLALIAVAIALGIGALQIARQGAMLPTGSNFTQLWMIQPDDADAVQFGVENNEGQAISYHLVVEGAGMPIEREFELEAGERWLFSLNLPATASSRVVANLYRLDQPDRVYRTTHLWLS